MNSVNLRWARTKDPTASDQDLPDVSGRDQPWDVLVGGIYSGSAIIRSHLYIQGEESMGMNRPDHPGPLMTTRTAIILTISVLAGLGVGILLGYDSHHTPQAVIGATAVFVSAIKLLHQWIAPDQSDDSKNRAENQANSIARITSEAPGCIVHADARGEGIGMPIRGCQESDCGSVGSAAISK